MEVRIELSAILYVDFSDPISANQVQLRRKLTVNLLTTNVRVGSSQSTYQTDDPSKYAKNNGPRHNKLLATCVKNQHSIDHHHHFAPGM